MGSDPRLEHDRSALLHRITAMEAQIDQLGRELAAANRLATIGNLMGMVAHEVNNLLTPVASYSQMALHSPEDRSLVAKALTRALEGTQQVTRIASAILGFMREDDQLKSADINNVIGEALSCMARDPGKSGIELVRDVPTGLRVGIRPICLQQIMLNLLVNAVEALKSRGGKVVISARSASPGRVRIDISDNGPGIPPAVLRRLATRGDKTAVAATVRADGHGMGLMVCRRLVEDAGGTMAVESQAGAGTIFMIDLPSDRT